MVRARFLLTFGLLLVGYLTVGPVLAGAATRVSSPIGYDVSFPDCGRSLPANPAFGIVGVNGGMPFTGNPCLGNGEGSSELRWAGMYAELYANTADPGPRGSTHWPEGQTTPEQCDTTTRPGPRTHQCAYDYGWDAASNSYQDALEAYIAVGWAPATATRTPVANFWWLDVEAANSWLASPRLNVAELMGEIAYLKSVDVAGVGIYAPRANWQKITGRSLSFSAYPSWMPGAGSRHQARARCAGPDSTHGGVALTQYPSGRLDGDYRCGRGWPALRFSTPARAAKPRGASEPIKLALSHASSSPVSVSVTSSSPTGSFALGPTGPWTSAASLLVPAGATHTASLYYRDSHAGHPLLRATSDGAYTDAGQHETIRTG